MSRPDGNRGPAEPSEEGVASRRVALEVLARVEDDGAYANLALSPVLDRSGLEERDRALVTDLVYGTLRRRRAMDHLVDRFLADPPPAGGPAGAATGRLPARRTTGDPDLRRGVGDGGRRAPSGSGAW